MDGAEKISVVVIAVFLVVSLSILILMITPQPTAKATDEGIDTSETLRRLTSNDVSFGLPNTREGHHFSVEDCNEQLALGEEYPGSLFVDLSAPNKNLLCKASIDGIFSEYGHDGYHVCNGYCNVGILNSKMDDGEGGIGWYIDLAKDHIIDICCSPNPGGAQVGLYLSEYEYCVQRTYSACKFGE